MSYIELTFIPFLVITLLAYYIAPRKYRYIVLFIASYIFYGFGNLSAVFVLLLVTVLTYIGGLLISKYPTRKVFAVFFGANILTLFFLKYFVFTVSCMNSIMAHMGVSWNIDSLGIIAPIGLSFYIFQSTTYLSDIYRKGMKPEKNFIRYASFVVFFPVILSGPIQKSRDLLPQLRMPGKFEAESFIRGFLLFLYGYFEKVVVSNKLKMIVDTCWNDMDNCTGFKPILAVVAFSLYIYCDFSAYSDMACGVSRMLGINVKNNFNRPYLATSLAEFWNCWHMTLNSWFIENVYIPLGGNRKGIARKYINVMAVFLFSGAWHGAAIHYIVWGGVNGLLQIIGQILKPLKKKMYIKMHVDDRCFSIRTMKRIGVFIIITFTWIFFRAPGMTPALEMIKKIASVRLIDLFDVSLLEIGGSTIQTLLCILMTIVFVCAQYFRKEGNKYYTALRSQPLFFQALFTGAVIFIIIMAKVSGTADVNTDFIYFQF